MSQETSEQSERPANAAQGDQEDFGEAYGHSPLALARRRPLPETEMDITPMIDITFLLLIFFLVASKMDPNNAVALPKARYGTSVVEKNSVVILVSKGTSDAALVARGPEVLPVLVLAG